MEPVTNATNPNAYRIEAEEKRKQAAQLANEANELEATAKALEQEADSSTPEKAPADTPSEQKEDKPKGKLFNK